MRILVFQIPLYLEKLPLVTKKSVVLVHEHTGKKKQKPKYSFISLLDEKEKSERNQLPEELVLFRKRSHALGGVI